MPIIQAGLGNMVPGEVRACGLRLDRRRCVQREADWRFDRNLGGPVPTSKQAILVPVPLRRKKRGNLDKKAIDRLVVHGVVIAGLFGESMTFGFEGCAGKIGMAAPGSASN